MSTIDGEERDLFLSTGVVVCESIRKQEQVLYLGLIWTRLGYYAKGTFEANKKYNNTNCHSLTPELAAQMSFFLTEKHTCLIDMLRHIVVFEGRRMIAFLDLAKRSLTGANQ